MIPIRLQGDELHERLGGGLPSGSLCLVEGVCGAGKSALASRLLYGALAHDARAAVVSTELTTPAFIQQMRSLGYPVVDALLGGRLVFLPTTPVLSRVRDASLRVPRLLGTREVFTRDLVIVDAFTALLGKDARDAGGEGLKLAEDTVRALKAITVRGTTVLLTADPADVPERALAPLRATSDVHLELALTTRGGVGRSVLVRRYARPGSLVGDAFNFRVEPGVGLIVEIRSVS